MRQAQDDLREKYPRGVLPTVTLDIYRQHCKRNVVYKFDVEAQKYLDDLGDSMATAFNGRFSEDKDPSDEGIFCVSLVTDRGINCTIGALLRVATHNL